MIAAILPLALDVARGVTGASPAAASTATATAGADFGQALASAASDAIKTLKTAETTSMAGLEGKASVQQVTESVMSAERTLQTSLAIRDKAISAYQQISQMQI
ncbi:flagellar hook-basal body complex protein FliE [Rhodoblastus sphagnicola]|uniref:Flagellar hook-basal body complex protein FliE n=1 Tax=Rhodoblastus sphagnicola TaxID=333368 RepID=A0A2S6NCJ6_9HYPH|nr:flagellar hook-basal body complex protein FliE [Rhodoblastus sphagnicola]MBB4199367.1 flagellar hook-basal body complex protein FliE [Rhodoblastus sphagnicola]PPQ32342.1 flagellar hook-basal body complex protein FliE [Rhodoblastus sphagnicola]